MWENNIRIGDDFLYLTPDPNKKRHVSEMDSFIHSNKKTIGFRIEMKAMEGKKRSIIIKLIDKCKIRGIVQIIQSTWKGFLTQKRIAVPSSTWDALNSQLWGQRLQKNHY